MRIYFCPRSFAFPWYFWCKINAECISVIKSMCIENVKKCEYNVQIKAYNQNEVAAQLWDVIPFDGKLCAIKQFWNFPF